MLSPSKKTELSAPVSFKVSLSSYANDYYYNLKNTAFTSKGEAKRGSKEFTAFSALDHSLRELIPHHAQNTAFALGRRGNVSLQGIFRTKPGRLRIFWIASKEKKEAIVLFIGNRKEGDRKDAYVLFEKYLKMGEFDHYFNQLELKIP